MVTDPAARTESPPSLPPTVGDGTRWLATATSAVTVATLGVALRGSAGPRPVPLLLAGLVLGSCGLWLERRGQRGPVPGTLTIVGLLTVLLAAQAFVSPTGMALDAFLGISGAAFVAIGVWRDDRRPVVVGIVQWASAAARPDGDVFRHCLVATDVRIPLPRVLPLVMLGVVALLVAVAMRERDWRVDAGRGLENAGLALFLGGLAAKALELPGHRLLCGTGDAVDLGWALLLLGAAAVVGWLGIRWNDRLWAAAGLTTATLFGLAAMLLEANPLWGVLVGVPLIAILLWIERAGVVWPRRAHAPLPPQDPS